MMNEISLTSVNDPAKLILHTPGQLLSVTFCNGKSLVWEEKIVGAATIVADSRV